ncbi:hypothetical protein PG990_015046 [Apiospora arundinis]
MPSFGRLGKQSNRSQHNLAAEQQQQQQQLQLQQQLQQQQQLVQQQPPPPPLSTLVTSSSGTGSLAGSAHTPPSASSTALSSSDSFHLQQDSRSVQQQQQQQQLRIQQQQQALQQQQQQQQQQQFQRQQQEQPLLQHQLPQFQQQHQQGPPPPLVPQQGQSQSFSGGNNNNSSNPGQSTTTNPTALTSNHPAGHTSDPANNSAAFNNINISNHHQQQQQQQQQQQFASRPLPKQQNSQDFSEQVSRSQSTRYPQQVSTPVQTQLQFAAASSADDLPQTLSSPIISQGQPLGQHQHQHHQSIGAPIQSQHHQQQQQQQQQPAAPTEAKRSARKLIKKIVAASGRSSNSNNNNNSSSNSSSSDHHSYHQHHNSYDNSPTLGRRSSKRISNTFPPSIRTTGVSQGSLESQQPSDWPPQDQQQPPPPPPKQQPQQPPPSSGHQPVNPSPLSQGGVPSCRVQVQVQVQTIKSPAPTPHQTTIRQVPTDQDSTPYSANEDIAYQHQVRAQQLLQQAQAHQAQVHVQADPQQQQSPQQQLYGRVVVDPAQDQYHHQYPTPPGQVQYQQGNPPPLYTTHLGAEAQHPNPETVSQLSHDSPITDTDARSSVIFSEQHTPALSYSQLDQRQVQPYVSSSPASQSDIMPPPPGQPPSTRRSGENEKNMRAAGQVEPPPGPPPGYRHSQGPNVGSLPPTPGVSANVQAYRASNVPERQQLDNAGAEGGRNSPQPSNTERESDPEKQFKDLLTKYKNVKRLYFDGKSQIEQLNGQVEQLQNAVANQRISQSRTALDDNEYQTRFNRLNGAINNLSFNIRKDWKTVPAWIEKYVSAEAIKTGKQEMTAVGRAVIIRWVVDEIFNKCFHPGLEIELSQHLKRIEQNIRRFSYTLSAAEEYEALTSKVVSWRMATLEGLQQALNAPESADHRQDFTTLTSTNLTAHLFQHMVEPPPPGVDGSVAMIVELAVGIAANLSLESRDVALVLPLPDPEEGEESGKDSEKAAKREKTKSGMLTMLGSQQQPGSRKGSIVSNTDMAEPTAPPPPKDASKVRFAGFIAVEVRGRQVLVKAPVWTL